jgi:hypothetical protein
MGAAQVARCLLIRAAAGAGYSGAPESAGIFFSRVL